VTRQLRTVLLAAGALVLGYLLAHALVGGSGGADHRLPAPGATATARRMGTVTIASRVPDRSAGAGPGPWRSAGGVPVGFEHSARGAVAATGNYIATLSRALTPGAPFSWTRAVRALTVAPFTARALSGSLASGMMSRRLQRSGSAYFLGSWALGYRLLSYTPARAQVALWTVGVMASAVGSVPPDFSTTTCELDWTAGDWKLSRARVSEGPTPPSPAAGSAQAVSFAAAARQFVSFREVP
jgi:hypothetical protein